MAKMTEMNEDHHNSHSTRIWYPRLQISRKNNMFEMNSNHVLISTPMQQKPSLSFETRFSNNLSWLKRSLALRQSNQEIQYTDHQRELSSDQVSSSSVPDPEVAPQFKVPFPPPSPLASHHAPRLKPRMKQFYSPPSEVSSLLDFSDNDAQCQYPVSEGQESESDKFLIIRRPDLQASAAECLGTEDNLGESSLSLNLSICARGQVDSHYVMPSDFLKNSFLCTALHIQIWSKNCKSMSRFPRLMSLSSDLFVPWGRGGFVFEVWLQPPLATLPLVFVSDFVLVSRKPRSPPLLLWPSVCSLGLIEGMLQAVVAGLITACCSNDVCLSSLKCWCNDAFRGNQCSEYSLSECMMALCFQGSSRVSWYFFGFYYKIYKTILLWHACC